MDKRTLQNSTITCCNVSFSEKPLGSYKRWRWFLQSVANYLVWAKPGWCRETQCPHWWDFGGYNSSSLGIRPSETRQTILNTIPWIQRYPLLALLEPVDQTTLQNSSGPTEHIWWFWWYVFIRIYPCTASLSLKQPHHLSGPKPQRPKSLAMAIVYHCLFHPCLGLFGCYHCWCDRQSCRSRHTVILGHTGTYILPNRRVSNEGVLGPARARLLSISFLNAHSLPPVLQAGC